MVTQQASTRAGAGVGRSLPASRIVIADDHPVIRRGVRDLLASAVAPGYDVVAEADTPRAAYEAVRRLRPDLLLIDVSMPPGSGLDVLDQCLQAHPELAAVIFTVHRDVELVRRAVALGALGYVLKDALAGELVTALRLAQRGSTYLPPGIAQQLAITTPRQAGPELDDRERMVLRLIAHGYTGAEIAAEVGVSERTVKNYRARVAEKLGVHHRSDLTRYAIRHGMLGAEDEQDGPRHPLSGAPRNDSGAGPSSLRSRSAEPPAASRRPRRPPSRPGDMTPSHRGHSS